MRHAGATRSRWILPAVVIGFAALAAATFAFTRSDGGSGEQLQALKDDPMATYVPTQSHLAQTVATDDRAGGAFSKQQTAKYLRLFSLPAARTDSAVREAVAAARAAGWEVSEVIAGVSATGRKQLASGPATLAISLMRTAAALPEDVAAPALSIALEHVRV